METVTIVTQVEEQENVPREEDVQEEDKIEVEIPKTEEVEK